MNAKAAKMLRIMAKDENGVVNKKLLKRLKSIHKSIPWNKRYVRG